MPKETLFISLVFSVTSFFTDAAIFLGIVGGLVGIASIFILKFKLDDFEDATRKQQKAVKELDTRVQRIESAVKPTKEV